MSISGPGSKMASSLIRNLGKSKAQHQDSVEKLASGSNFTSMDPRPADRAISEKMDFRLRSLAVAKKNANDAVSMFQTAEDALSEISNIVVRMKEINTTASSTTMTDKERRFLFVEYEALHSEVDRIARSTEFNGIALLNGDSDSVPETLSFRIGDVVASDDGTFNEADDVNTIKLDGLKNVVSTSIGLGLKSSADILRGSSAEEGVSIEDANDLMVADSGDFATVYDSALNTISSQRAVFGALQSRLNKAIDYIDVYHENIAAAKSNISDTDYAMEVVKMTQSAILTQATSGLMSQLNFESGTTLSLLNSLR